MVTPIDAQRTKGSASLNSAGKNGHRSLYAFSGHGLKTGQTIPVPEVMFTYSSGKYHAFSLSMLRKAKLEELKEHLENHQHLLERVAWPMMEQLVIAAHTALLVKLTLVGDGELRYMYYEVSAPDSHIFRSGDLTRPQLRELSRHPIPIPNQT